MDYRANPVDDRALRNFINTKGAKAKRVLATLGRLSPFAEALSRPVGQEILKDAMEMLEERLEKIVNEESSEAERAEYRVLKELAKRWASKIQKYEETALTINASGGS